MNLSEIHHIAIIVSDYEAAKDFYVNKLGFSVIRENYRPERKEWKLEIQSGKKTENRADRRASVGGGSSLCRCAFKNVLRFTLYL